MIPSADLIECTNCDGWFAGASLDEVFYHGTCACCREVAAPTRTGPTFRFESALRESRPSP